MSYDVIRMIGGNQPQIANTSVTPKDVHEWFDIHGEDVAALRGKSKNKFMGSRAQRITVQIDSEHTLHADPIEINDHHFVLGVDKPLGLSLVTPVSNIQHRECGTALYEQMTVLRERGYNATKIVVDRAKALLKLKGRIENVIIDPVGAGDHQRTEPRPLRRALDAARQH